MATCPYPTLTHPHVLVLAFSNATTCRHFGGSAGLHIGLDVALVHPHALETHLGPRCRVMVPKLVVCCTWALRSSSIVSVCSAITILPTFSPSFYLCVNFWLCLPSLLWRKHCYVFTVGSETCARSAQIPVLLPECHQHKSSAVLGDSSKRSGSPIQVLQTQQISLSESYAGTRVTLSHLSFG